LNPRNINGCSTCSSSFLSYLSIVDAPTKCIPDPNNAKHKNIELFTVINKDSEIGFYIQYAILI